jgi:hypothetical protein
MFDFDNGQRGLIFLRWEREETKKPETRKKEIVGDGC